MQLLAILGASGHGKVLADAALCMGWQKVVFFDDKWPILNKVNEWDVVGNTDSFMVDAAHMDGVIIAIGDNRIRSNIASQLKDSSISLTKIIHPSSTISRYALIGDGTVIFAGVVVNANCVIGRNCIINTGATIDHDCVLADGVHVCPGANLAGEVNVGDLSWIGIGACVRQQITIGREVMVGAGTVVICDIDDRSTVVGVPGKIRAIQEV